MQIDERILETPSQEKLQRQIINFLLATHIEGSIGIVEIFQETIPDRMSGGLVGMLGLEIQSGPGEGVFDMVNNPVVKI